VAEVRGMVGAAGVCRHDAGRRQIDDQIHRIE
jgi:hypothetical protein